MRNLTLTAAITVASLSTSALAEDWVHIVTNDNLTRYFVARDTIRRQPNGYKRAWEQVYLAEPRKYGMTRWKTHTEYDCSGARSRTLQAGFFKGNELLTMVSDPQPWRRVPKGTIFKRLLEFVCFGKLTD